MPRERDVARRMLRAALDAGCEAVVLTTDVPVGGNREYNERNGLSLPLVLRRRTLLDALAHPRWLLGVGARLCLARDSRVRLPEWATRRDHMSWQDFAWLRDAWPRKLLVKGVLGVEDAQLAVEHGADGIFVSNHGGRQLDGCLPGAEALPEVVDAVDGRAAVLVDGGIRRGIDVAIALALGADAVLVGRPALWGLAVGGEEGARRILEILSAELELTLALCGCATPAELDRSHVKRAPTPSVYSL
jgi:L-lactate dehydrogenase (cytochrome)/(S)-mandelate dehydrogenase